MKTFWAQFHNGSREGIQFEVIDVALCGTELRLKLPNEEWYFVKGGDIVVEAGIDPYISDWHVDGKDWMDFGCANNAYEDMRIISREGAPKLKGLTLQ